VNFAPGKLSICVASLGQCLILLTFESPMTIMGLTGERDQSLFFCSVFGCLVITALCVPNPPIRCPAGVHPVRFSCWGDGLLSVWGFEGVSVIFCVVFPYIMVPVIPCV